MSNSICTFGNTGCVDCNRCLSCLQAAATTEKSSRDALRCNPSDECKVMRDVTKAIKSLSVHSTARTNLLSSYGGQHRVNKTHYEGGGRDKSTHGGNTYRVTHRLSSKDLDNLSNIDMILFPGGNGTSTTNSPVQSSQSPPPPPPPPLRQTNLEEHKPKGGQLPIQRFLSEDSPKFLFGDRWI